MASKKKSTKKATPKTSTAHTGKAKHCKNCTCEQIPGATFCHHCNVPQ